MAVTIHEIPCNFVGTFKVGDNLGYNAGVMCGLAECNQANRFNKMIVLQVGSIMEASLSQIIFRAQNYNIEGVPNISEDDRLEIEGKKVDKFNSVIDVLRKYSVLDGLGADIYDDLHKLRRYRNKIHIQESIPIEGVHPDEHRAFTRALTNWAMELNLRVLSHLNEALARPGHIADHVQPITVPTGFP